jgi:hypothetical protein
MAQLNQTSSPFNEASFAVALFAQNIFVLVALTESHAFLQYCITE